MSKWTPGPWPWAYTGDGKRIVIGEGLVEGPNGYEVAEVYSDDCPREVAEANARLISLAPEMAEALEKANRLLAHAFNRIHILPRTTDTELADRIEKGRGSIRTLLAKLEAEG